MDKLAEGKHIFDVEIKALQMTRDALNNTFVQILDVIGECNGKVSMTGLGTRGHIAA